LLYDNGSNSDDRITIFATDDGLKLLSEAEEWFMDGNFALSPTEFQQLYVIRIQVKTIFITPVFCLLKRKTQSSYEQLIKILLEKCNEREIYLDPLIVHVDFEKAVIEALKNTIGNHICIKGCFYHLTQSTHRKIQNLGLENMYRNNNDFSIFCRKLDSLAFLPENKVLEGMDFLRTIMPPEATDLVDYFDTTYVHGSYRSVQHNHGIRLRNIAPLYPPSIWNVYQTTLDNGHRTNNETEGWNHRFSKLVGHNHPSIWSLIKKMRLELSSDETKLAQFVIGNLSKKKKKKLMKKCKKNCIKYVVMA